MDSIQMQLIAIYKAVYKEYITLTSFVPFKQQILLMYSKNTFRQGVCNDGSSHVETSSICAVPLGIVQTSGVIYYVGGQAQPLLIYSKNTFCQGVSNDGGSHVETSSICAVPLGIIQTSGVTYYICSATCTWGSQAQPLYNRKKSVSN